MRVNPGEGRRRSLQRDDGAPAWKADCGAGLREPLTNGIDTGSDARSKRAPEGGHCARSAIECNRRRAPHARPPAARWPSGSAAPAFTSPSEKLVCRSFTLGSLNRVSIVQCA